MATRLVKAALTTSILALALVGCSEPTDVSEDSTQNAGEDTSAPTDELNASEGTTVEPGLASCEFDSTPEGQQTAGPTDYSGEALDTVELCETEDAYEVSMTGELFNPEELLTEQGE